MPLTSNAQKLVNNIKALNSVNFNALSRLLFKNKDRLYDRFAASLLNGRTTWVNSTYANSFVDKTGQSFSNVLSSVFTGTNPNQITDWTEADSVSLVQEFFKTPGSENNYLRNLYFGLLKGDRTVAISTEQYPTPSAPSDL